MNNFSFCNPVKIIFGKDSISKIATELPTNAKVLMLYGGGSIKKNGVYSQVTKALGDRVFLEFGAIEANPRFETCMKAVALIKEQSIDYLLAVGGGSVLDATKFISAASCYQGTEAWDIIAKELPLTKALPFGAVLTLPATGSEMNSGAVITRESTKDKLAFNSPLVFPQFSVLDPSVTFSLPSRQVANGIIDTFVHVVEQYLTDANDAPLQDYFAESILQVLFEEGPKALTDPNNYEVRANLMWASTWALNGWIACGVKQDWATHIIGHEITALYELDHAQTLAIILPGVMKVMKKHKGKKIQQMGKRIFGIQAANEEEQIAQTINAVEAFFNSLGVKTRLGEYGIEEKVCAEVAERIKLRGWKLGEHGDITSETVAEILAGRM
ncbi:aldehyde reductase [Bacteroidales bacterium]|nr:aldehyde reductase [Bacteroidales bacterium]